MTSTAAARARELAAQQDDSAIRDYWAIVRAIASGDGEPDLAKLAESRRALGKSPEDFSRDCEQVAQRVKMRAEVDRRDELQKELAEHETKLAAADERLRRAVERHERETAEPTANARRLRHRLGQIDTAESELASRCPYPWLADRAAELDREARAVGQRRADLRAAIGKLQSTADYRRRQAAGEAPLDAETTFEVAQGSSRSADRRERAARMEAGKQAQRHDKRAAELREALEAADAQAERLAAEQRALRDEMLKP